MYLNQKQHFTNQQNSRHLRYWIRENEERSIKKDGWVISNNIKNGYSPGLVRDIIEVVQAVRRLKEHPNHHWRYL